MIFKLWKTTFSCLLEFKFGKNVIEKAKCPQNVLLLLYFTFGHSLPASKIRDRLGTDVLTGVRHKNQENFLNVFYC